MLSLHWGRGGGGGGRGRRGGGPLENTTDIHIVRVEGMYWHFHRGRGRALKNQTYTLLSGWRECTGTFIRGGGGH